MTDEPEKTTEENEDAQFYPSGAIAFFSVMLASFVVIWLMIYALMIHRS